MERVKAIEDEGEVVVKVLRLATFLTLVRLFHMTHDFEELLTTNTIINISQTCTSLLKRHKSQNEPASPGG